MSTPPLPPGFQMLAPQAAPPLPPGFQIVQPDAPDLNAELQKENNDSMSGIDKFRVALGRGMLDVGQGAKQLLLRGADAISIIPGGAHLADKYTQEVEQERAGYDQAGLRKDSPKTAIAGRFLGNVAAMPLPAGKGATLLSKVLGGATAGAATGAIQFVPEGGSRLQNTALGAVVGGVLPGVIQAGKVTVGAVKDLAGKLKDLMPAVSSEVREQMAAKILREAVADPSKLARAAQNTQLIPGTQQTLAEATDDVGLAGLQRTMQSMSPEFNSRVAGVAQQNNAARVEALRGGFGGADEASAAALEAARDRATAPLLAAAYKAAKPTKNAADSVFESGIVPEGSYVHGRAGTNSLNTGNVLQLSNNTETAAYYAGNKGSRWLITPRENANILRLSENSPDMDKVVKAALKDFKRGKLPFVGDIDPSASLDDIERIIRTEFAPDDIVNSAAAFDNKVWSEWLGKRFKNPFVETPDGAVVFSRKAVNAVMAGAKSEAPKIDVTPTVTLANRILKAREGNDTVTGVVSRVRDLLSREGLDDVRKLHNVRQEIGTILSGQSSNEQAGKVASRELMAIRESLDAQISKASPEFRKFLNQYASLSKEAGRVRMGDELLGKSAATLDNMGNPVLSPAKFANAANDLDRVAKAATGFRKETADRLMTPEQKAIVANVRADLDRYARSQTGGKAVGSNSLQNAAGMAKLQDVATHGNELQAALLPQLTLAKSLFNGVRKNYGEKVLNIVQEAMLNPQRANQLLRALPAAQRAQASAVLQSARMKQIAGAVQAMGPTLFANAAAAQEQN